MNLRYLISKLIKKIHLPAIKDSCLSKNSRVCPGSHLVKVELDSYSYIGNFCTVINTKVGKFCSIGDNNIIGGASHPMGWVSTSPVFYEGKNILGCNFSNHKFESYKKTIIGNDVWIGNNCLIKGGVEIKNGAVIGMGSVVTKDVGAYEVWAGNPARMIKKRFDNEIIIDMLLKSNWWNYSDDKLVKTALNFNDVEKFIKNLEIKVE